MFTQTRLLSFVVSKSALVRQMLCLLCVWHVIVFVSVLPPSSELLELR